MSLTPARWAFSLNTHAAVFIADSVGLLCVGLGAGMALVRHFRDGHGTFYGLAEVDRFAETEYLQATKTAVTEMVQEMRSIMDL